VDVAPKKRCENLADIRGQCRVLAVKTAQAKCNIVGLRIAVIDSGKIRANHARRVRQKSDKPGLQLTLNLSVLFAEEGDLRSVELLRWLGRFRFARKTWLSSLRERDKPRQGVAANTLKLHRNGAVGFMVCLDDLVEYTKDLFSGSVVIIRREIMESTACPVEQPRAGYVGLFRTSAEIRGHQPVGSRK
jgi:hypothetical protein